MRKIFSLAAQGLYEADIAEILTADGFANPSDYKRICTGKQTAPRRPWRTKAVRDILRDIQYTGARVSGKFYFDENGKKHRTHDSDWFITPDDFPAIITKTEFDAVTELMANRGKRKFKPVDYLLHGNIVICGCCGHAMTYDKLSDPVYHCYHTAADPFAKCHKLKVSVRELDEVVLTAIRKKAELVLNTADLSKLRRKSIDERKIAKAESDVEQIGVENRRQYERFVLGEITSGEYADIKADNNKRLERLNRQLDAMKSELDSTKIDPRAVAAAKSAVGETSIARELVETLIDTVRVFPNKRVEINWKIAGFGSAN